MEPKDFLGKKVKVVVDRKMGSHHPKFGFIYPINYGYIEETKSPDGEELDAYILGVFEPVDFFVGEVIAFIERQDDDDPKLIVVPAGKSYSKEAIFALVEFQERYFKSNVVQSMASSEKEIA